MTLVGLAYQLRPLIEKAARSLEDGDAAQAPALFPRWREGEALEAGERRFYPPTGRLYKALQAHTSQADWTPDQAPALWAVVTAGQAGTADRPIEAARGMEYEYGLYYLDPEDEKTYLCKRGSETGTIVLQYLPHELIGHYFEEAET